MTQTSVEWLEERFQMYLSWYEGHHSAKEYKLEDFAKDFQEAKEWHKQEVEDAFQDGKWDWDQHITHGIESQDLAEYYNVKYKKD